MKNKILTLLALITMMVLVGCTVPTEAKKHSITYCVDGEVIKLEPNSYEEGKGLTLPTPLIEPGSGKVFSGWYLNKNYTGNTVTKIDEKQNEDLVLYGRILNKKETYQIAYYIDGVKKEYMPNEYQQGTEVILPTPEVEEGFVFSGWYDNPSFNGEVIAKVTTVGDLEFFGKMIAQVADEPNLAQALNKNNYTYDFTTISGETESTYSYLYNKGDIFMPDSDPIYCQYLATVNGEKRYIFSDGNDWYYIGESDEYFEYYEMAFINIDFSKISANDFSYEKEDNRFKVNENSLQELAQKLLGYYDNEYFSSFYIYVEDSQIVKMTFTSSYSFDGETFSDYEYEIIFKDYGTTSFTIPDALPYEDVDLYTISDVYDLEDGTTDVAVVGVIMGIYGNNFYLSDEEKGILVYCGSNSSFVNSHKVGDEVVVVGEVDIYKEVYQLTNISSVEDSDMGIIPFQTKLTDLNQTTLQKYVNDTVDVENVTIKTLPTSYPTTGSDVSFTVEMDGVVSSVFISKHLDSASKTVIFDYLKQKQVGDLIDLSNVHISRYTAYQLVLSNVSVLEDGFKNGDPVVPTRIELSTDQLVVKLGTTLDEILENISVFVVNNDKSKVLLNSSEYTLEHRFVPNTIGDFTFNFTYQTFKTSCIVSVQNATTPNESFYPEINRQPLYDVLSQMGYDEETGETYGVSKGLPSVGSPEVLVIPIAFTDALAPSTMVSDLEKAFFGTSEETGWESLSSYYYKSSYGKFNIQGKVLEPFNTGKTVSYYDKLQKEYNKALDDYYNYVTDVYPDNVEFSIIKAALAYYDNVIDYSKYDSDNDGYIDSIYFVYTTNYNDTDDESLWWAFTTEYFTEDVETYDDVEADYYTFFSYQFLFDELQGKKVKYNAETIIHETGHLLGLTDYYDYDETTGPSGGIGGGDMMDYNVGDHNAYSKILLGWVTPLVVTGKTTTVELESFEQSGDCVCIFSKWNGTFFDEFYVIDFFTPTGVNEFGKGSSGLFSTSGIRVYHVDATLNDPKDCFSVFDVTKYNNTDSSHKLIALVEADGRNDITNGGYSENSDLFKVGQKITNLNWYTGKKVGVTITVDSMDSQKAKITITY